MNKTSEIYQDIQLNCEVILSQLKYYPVSNDTAEGRMIYQCRWLKEQAAAGTLPIPVLDYVSTLKMVYTEHNLEHLYRTASEYIENTEKVLYRLLKLIKGNLLAKHDYYPFATRVIDELVEILGVPNRPLTLYERGLVVELMKLRELMTEGKLKPPLMYCLPEFPNFCEVFSLTESSIDDLNGGGKTIKIVADFVFEGVRPASWVTPEAADSETQRFTGVKARHGYHR
jgi:hypothetical protein